MTAVRFPAMRANLKAYAESLADEEYQARVWVGQETPPSHDTFTDIVHFFYDDTKLAEDPDRCVGLFLRDHSEVGAARKVVDALDAVFAEFGTSRPDKDYVTATAWPRVVAAATILLGIMDRLDKASLRTLSDTVRVVPGWAPSQTNKSFLLLFFKKEVLSSFLETPVAPTQN